MHVGGKGVRTRRTGMRILKLAALAVVATGLLGGAAFTSAPAKAQGVSVDIGGGPGIHYGDRDDWRWRHRGFREGDDWRWRHRGFRAEAYGGGCRTVVRREWRGDHEVVIRR